MEARRVELLSRTASASRSTCVVGLYISPEFPARHEFPWAYPLFRFRPHTRGRCLAYPILWLRPVTPWAGDLAEV